MSPDYINTFVGKKIFVEWERDEDVNDEIIGILRGRDRLGYWNVEGDVQSCYGCRFNQSDLLAILFHNDDTSLPRFTIR